MDLSLPQFYSRIGSKRKQKKIIYELMPNDFKTYIEPYVGGGSVFLGYSFKPNTKIIINDLDKDLIKRWRSLKDPPSMINIEKYNTDNLDKLRDIVNSTGGDNLKNFVKNLLISNNTFSSKGYGKIYKRISPYNKLKNVPKYKEKMKNVVILNQDALSVIKKYNKSDTFLYLDPPYENSERLYDKSAMNFEELAKVLRNFKGKFLLSINNSTNIRKIFNGFKMYTTTAGTVPNSDIGGKLRKELYIKNY